ncbi:hypothetical protein EC973_005429, partial [Apophysomyces ossiformis]
MSVYNGDTSSRGFIYVSGVAGAVILLEILVGQQWYFGYLSMVSELLRLSSMLQIEIYRKTFWRVDIAGEHSKRSTSGKVVNLMGTDISRITNFLAYWFNLIESPAELAIGIYFLYSLLGYSCLLGFLVMVVMLPLNQYASKSFSSIQDDLMGASDRRVALMNELLQCLRQVKFFAWESRWEKRILNARENELYLVRRSRVYEVLLNFLWDSSPILVTVVSFWSYTKIAEQQLTASVAFTSIAIFNELQFALNTLPETVVEFVQALSSLRRIEEFLHEEEISPRETGYTGDAKLAIIGATIAWSNASKPLSTSESNPDDFTLKDVDVEFPYDKLSVICGPTGSGKTMMILSLLGETTLMKGSISFPRAAVVDTPSVIPDIIPLENWILPGGVAYVSQTAWLQNASIRDNILFGLPYVENRYKETLLVCALDKDLSIFEDGDHTEIGEKGITLSGGQKARVSLARAVYSRAQIVLMDDVLSAVDAPTATHIYNRCIMGQLMESRTRILVTHHVNLCFPGAANLIYIDRGSVLSKPVTEWRDSDQLMGMLNDMQTKASQMPLESRGERKGEEPDVDEGSNYSSDSDDYEDFPENSPKVLVQKEVRADGSVKRRVYQVYLNLIGGWGYWLVLLLVILSSRGIQILVPWWVKKWTQYHDDKRDSASFTINNRDKDQLNFYLGIYVCLALLSVVVVQLPYAIVYWGGLRGSKRLHAELLQRVLRVPLRVLDITPIGRLLNRFSKDLARIDDKVPNLMMDIVVDGLVVFSSILTVAFVLPSFMIPMVMIAAMGIALGKKYLIVSRECKRLDSISHSPILTHFSETLVGITTIRAFGATSIFLEKMLDRVETNAKPYFYIWIANRWVSFRFATLGAIACFIASATVMLSLDYIDASAAGFCLTFVFVFNDEMFSVIRQYTKLEMGFNAVERAVELTEIDQEAPAVTSIRPPLGWPSEGRIEVKDLEVRYAPDLPA